jgi:hypothetical protein
MLTGEISTSECLHQRRKLFSSRLWAAHQAFWRHPEAARIYPSLLFRSHCLARASVPLLETAVARLEPRCGADPVAAPLLAFLRGFISEEMGHDEWLLEDLEALGFSRQEICERIPPPTLASLVGAQYYWINHCDPVSILGLLFVTETSPPPLTAVEDLIQRTALPRDAFRSLLRHAVLDLRHGADVERTLDALPLSPAQLSLIGVSLAHTTQCLAVSTEEIVELYDLEQIV